MVTLDYPQIADYFQYSYKYIKFEVFKNIRLFQKILCETCKQVLFYPECYETWSQSFGFNKISTFNNKSRT